MLVTYEEERLKFVSDVRDKLVTIAIDGWSNVANEPIVIKPPYEIFFLHRGVWSHLFL